MIRCVFFESPSVTDCFDDFSIESLCVVLNVSLFREYDKPDPTANQSQLDGQIQAINYYAGIQYENSWVHAHSGSMHSHLHQNSPFPTTDISLNSI
jgi:hypothetical protein